MNGFADRGLNEGAFGEKNGGFRENIRTFDAFRKTSLYMIVPSYDTIRETSSQRRWSHPLLTPPSIYSQNETHLHPSHLDRWLHHPSLNHHIPLPLV